MHRLLVIGATALISLAVGAPAGAWTWPADGAVLRPFGLGPDPYAGGQHRGVDVAGPEGSSVRAPAAGTVTFAGSLPTHGRGITIQTESGFAVTLVHLGTIGVEKGVSVAERAVVGTIGWSGTPEHPVASVHLGIRRTNEAEGYVDPLGLLPPRSAPAPPSAPAPSPAPAAATAPTPVSVPAPPSSPPPAPAPVAPPAATVGPPVSSVAPSASPPAPTAAAAVAVTPAGSAPGGVAQTPPAPVASTGADRAGVTLAATGISIVANARARSPSAVSGSSTSAAARTSSRVGRYARAPREASAAATNGASGVLRGPARPTLTVRPGAAVADGPPVGVNPLASDSRRARRDGPADRSPAVDRRVTPAAAGAAGPLLDPTGGIVRALPPGVATAVRAPRASIGGPPPEAGAPDGGEARVPLGPVLATFALGGLLAAAVARRGARRIGADGAVLPHDADLLRELDPAHRARVHDRGGGHLRAPPAAARP